MRERQDIRPRPRQFRLEAIAIGDLQTLGHFALGHADPKDFSEFLRQRVEANYFAGAVLLPESAARSITYKEREGQRGISLLKILRTGSLSSYEMAGHRFTNLATEHLETRHPLREIR